MPHRVLYEQLNNCSRASLCSAFAVASAISVCCMCGRIPRGGFGICEASLLLYIPIWAAPDILISAKQSRAVLRG